MKDMLFTARRAVGLPWIDDGRYYEMTTGRGTAPSEVAKSPTAYACMTVRGQELANIPWHIKRGDEILENHYLADMLKDFGPESNYQRGMLYTEMDMLIYGAALWLRDVDELRRLNPGTIKVIKDNTGIKGFKQTLIGPNGEEKTKFFDRDEVIYFREYHPDDDLDFGVPIMEVCKKSIKSEIEALLMLEAFFKNDAVPGIIFTSDQDVPEREANRFLSWWRARFQGSRNKGKVGVAGRGLTPNVVGNSLRENAIVELLDSLQADICKAFRVDPILTAGNQDATYVNLNESRKFLIEDVIMPRAIEMQNVINQDLVKKVDRGLEFKFAFDELQILQEDATQKHTRLAGAVTMGLISEEYYREEMGYPEKAKPKEDPDRAEVKQEIAEGKWEKKAVKALLKGESPVVPFETDNITIDRQYVIRGRLQNADSEDAVRACFGK